MKKPQYKIISESLKAQIHSGKFSEGDLLPSENTLSSIHNITRTTIRKSLNELEKEGYIIKHQGKGSIVIQQRKKLGLLSFNGFSSSLKNTKFTTHTETIHKAFLKKWDKNFFYTLNSKEESSGCIFLIRLRFVEKTPVMLEKTYIPNIDLPNFCEKEFVNGSLFETLLIHYNIEIINVDQDIKAILSTKEESDQLKIKKGTPLLHIYRKYSTNRDNFNLYSSLFCNTNDFSIGNFFN